ncbi:protein YgfX [Reinekea marinisedimentorum]|uniref:Toxin CptA n=1 Tax=Reinekea marinisedimentorum TaxID=230495 RepID=A0A4R3I6U0_9GAMM|nr:protein YgfX [Reinekea marinisedimentorum]TCS39799.1 hypothetical protein BCF53_11284 [Reinekea marinisedimentorum]
MPVRVDATLKPSRWRWWVLFIFCLTGAASTFIISKNIWLTLSWVLLVWVIYASRRSEEDINRVTFEADYFALWNPQGEKQEYRWQGEGRLSSLFISFQLHNEACEALKLIIWRDSLSDASWRALNMAFRVAQPSLLNEHSGNEGSG